VLVAGVDGALEVAGTGDTFCARAQDGSVRCWGSDHDGGLGDGVGAPDRCTASDGSTIGCALAPHAIRALDAIDLSARAGTFCAARRDGSVACWGRGYGELPMPVPSPTM
jgi:hypothetical protein